jgi:hypothetical protein
VESLVPVEVLAAESGGPHEVEDGEESDAEIEGTRAPDIPGENDARSIERDEEVLADFVIGTVINTDDLVGVVLDAAKERFSVDGSGPIAGNDLQAKVREELEGIGPGFEAVAGVAHEDGVLAVGSGEAGLRRDIGCESERVDRRLRGHGEPENRDGEKRESRARQRSDHQDKVTVFSA